MREKEIQVRIKKMRVQLMLKIAQRLLKDMFLLKKGMAKLLRKQRG